MNFKITLPALFICLQLSFLAQTNGVSNPGPNGAGRPISPPVSVMDANAGIATSYTNTACGLDYTQANVKLTLKPFNGLPASVTQPATLAISGIPPCANILKAFLYTILSGNGAAVTASITNPAASNMSFLMSTIGNDIDLCWGYVGTYSYRADVTAIVNGNGNYILSGLPVGNPNDAAGALLFIIYSDASQLYTGNIVIADGCRVLTGSTYGGNTVTGFSVCGTPSLTAGFMVTADLQRVGDTYVNFNGATNAAASTNYTKTAITDQAWDYITAPAAQAVSGQTSANLGVVNVGGDCLAVGMAGLYYRTSCLACNGISPGPSLTVTAIGTGSCAGMGSATVSVNGGSGQYFYAWLGTPQTTSVISGLNDGVYTVLVTDLGSCNTGSTQVNVSQIPFSGQLNNSPQLPCGGLNTGTANVIISGGTGYQNYLWTGPNGTQTTAIASGLSAGNYTVVITDAFTSCVLSDTFVIGPPPAPLGVTIAAGAASVCAGGAMSFTATGSGGASGPPPLYTYSWSPGPMGAIYNASTPLAGNYIYTVTAKDLNNCIATATVPAAFIANPVLLVPSISICTSQTGVLTVSGASSYTWSNNTNLATLIDNPAATTTYSVIGAAQGCTASATASITVNPVPVPTLATNGPVCTGKVLNLNVSGGDIYAWSGPSNFISALSSPQINPASVNNSGVYTVTVTTLKSCTASASIGYTVYPPPAIGISGSTICTTQTLTLLSGAPTAISYTWTGPGGFTSSLQNPTINNPPTSASGIYSIAVTSANGCTNSTSANVTVVDIPLPSFTTDSPKCEGQVVIFNSSQSTGGVNYAWSGPNAFSSVAQNPVIINANPLGSGIYTLTLTTGPCVATATAAVIIYPNPVPVILNSGPVCETKSFSLSVSTAFPTYFWSGPLNYTTTSQGFSIESAQVNQSGLYSVVVTDTNTCQGSSSLPVTVGLNPVLTVLGAQACIGDLAVISASGAATYAWTGPFGFTATIQHPTITVLSNPSPLIYNVMGTGLNTCTSVASVQVLTRVLPIATASITPKACVSSEIYFKGEADGDVTYSWTGPLNFVRTQQNFSVVAINEGMSGNYTLMVTDQWGCRGYTNKTITVDPAPQGSLWSSNPQRCVPFCSDFKLSVDGAPIIESVWQINGQAFTGESFNYCFSSAGDYTVRGDFISDRDCKSTVAFVVNAYPLPEADYSYFPQLPMEFDEIQFNSTSNSPELKSWSWYFAQNEAYPENSPVVSHIFQDAGTYPVALVIKNKWGCADTVVESILVDEDFYVYVPNAFTPNDDDVNETFTAKGWGIKTYSMLIYDRWGEKVFESNSITTGWDGSYKGKVCKSDEYNWKLSVTSIKGKEKKMTGSVLLYR